MDLIKQVGAFAGLAAFMGLAVLALLYFAQARDVRRLRENASFLLENPETEGLPADRPAVEASTATASPPPGSDVEAFRRAELARQAEERRRRFEQRRRTGGPGGYAERLGEIPGGAVMVVGAVLLLAGIGFGGSKLLSGGTDESAKSGPVKSGQEKAQVAVFNGTAQAGLAQEFANQVGRKGFDLVKISNTSTPAVVSAVMFEPGNEQAANEIATALKITTVTAMNAEIRLIAKGAAIAVVLGEDKATSGI